MAFTGVVLAGGSSRRMGTDKASLVIEGRPLMERSFEALRSGGAAEILVVGDGGTHPSGGTRVRDRWPGEGPLGALVTALRAASEELVVVLACDLVAVTGVVVGDLVRRLDACGSDAVVPEVEGRLQPLSAAYRRRSASALEASFATGNRRIDAAVVTLDVLRALDLDPSALVDADSPADLDRLGLRRSRPEET